ncbi:hypothetical protein PTUN_b0111 [Pseudoalteromonas tunicata]|nr:hypothetical protein PTUN_b0111 [Pseudoalteromonas tunicata]
MKNHHTTKSIGQSPTYNSGRAALAFASRLAPTQNPKLTPMPTIPP